jgi:hypothetical protein
VLFIISSFERVRVIEVANETFVVTDRTAAIGIFIPTPAFTVADTVVADKAKGFALNMKGPVASAAWASHFLKTVFIRVRHIELPFKGP